MRKCFNDGADRTKDIACDALHYASEKAPIVKENIKNAANQTKIAVGTSMTKMGSKLNSTSESKSNDNTQNNQQSEDQKTTQSADEKKQDDEHQTKTDNKI
ncbi:hypothetical protein DICVIV_01933 [Dictyocaulus viviparus]|uniref:Uncharacterized protein n=1 Tax=Dictyocaulus viviparus TaxID=29172 RepID=A0A0D8Y7A9_DICVI|nr:hypothetical protein DICVIV_01933 [Dictyocaulus viviparus]